MFDDKLRKFTFRCDTCFEIMASEFEDEKDVSDVIEDKLWLECPCGGKALLLRD